MQRLKEMKRVNRKGGDDDGFKYVIPKNHKQLLHLEQQLTADPTKELADPTAKLSSHFGGDGVEETEKIAGKRKTRKPRFKDDFYQLQNVKKWTKRAENFLSKTRKGRQLQQARMKANRTIKRL
jgi:hypothetical protein